MSEETREEWRERKRKKKCEPHHKPCKYCGGTGKAVNVSENPNIITDWAIQCQSCGRKTEPTWSVRTAWRFWDDGEVPEGEQLNLFDKGMTQ